MMMYKYKYYHMALKSMYMCSNTGAVALQLCMGFCKMVTSRT
jgi:hypothetical protein